MSEQQTPRQTEREQYSREPIQEHAVCGLALAASPRRGAGMVSWWKKETRRRDALREGRKAPAAEAAGAEHRDPADADLPRRPWRDLLHIVLIWKRVDPIDVEEDQRGHGARTLVPVLAGVVLGDVIETGGSHCREVRVEILAANLW